MGVCRLCLKDVEGTGISNPSETIKLLRTFIPHMNRTIKQTPVVCEICCENANTAEKFLRTKTETETKIIKEVRRLKVAKINLRGFHQNVSNTVSVCRICLKLISNPRIFLCENNTNILRHDFIKNMFKFCSMHMNFGISDRPVMCIKCWEDLQITYSFKKDYLEVERKIRIYCRDFKLSSKRLSLEVLAKVQNYFSEDYCEITSCDIKKEDDCYMSLFPTVKKEPHTYETSTPLQSEIKQEYTEYRYVKHEHANRYLGSHIPPKVITFTKAHNLILMKVYYEVTNNEKHFPIDYWKKISDRWSELMPKKPISIDKLGQQIQKVFAKKLLSVAELERIKKGVSKRQREFKKKEIEASQVEQIKKGGEARRMEQIKKGVESRQIEQTKKGVETRQIEQIKKGVETREKRVQLQINQETQQNSDSDDSFIEEVVHSSFTPCIKTEQLNESDIEFNSIETKLEVESDCESLPQLERMDLPPLDFKIENIYSLEVKREAFDQYIRLEDDVNADADDANKSRRGGLRDRKGDIFKCGECNFETRYRWCAERHNYLHRKGKHAIHQCPSCPYRISNKWLFQRHMRTHKEKEDEIPVLQPSAFPTY